MGLVGSWLYQMEIELNLALFEVEAEDEAEPGKNSVDDYGL